jgi:hypothetical protein
MLLQLNPPIPVMSPKGKGLAHVLIDYSAEHDLLWVVFQDETGECWTWNNKEIRGQPNLTMNRPEVVAPLPVKRERPRVVPNE